MYARLVYKEGELPINYDRVITIYHSLDEEAHHHDAKIVGQFPTNAAEQKTVNKSSKILDKLKKAACYAVPPGIGRDGINTYYSKEKFPEMKLEEAKLRGLLAIEEEKEIINWRTVAAFLGISGLMTAAGSLAGVVAIGGIFSEVTLGAEIGASIVGGINTLVYAGRFCFFANKFIREERDEEIDLQRLNIIPVDLIKIIASYSPELYQDRMDYLPPEPVEISYSRDFRLPPKLI